jgi:hypothetical protein
MLSRANLTRVHVAVNASFWVTVNGMILFLINSYLHAQRPASDA